MEVTTTSPQLRPLPSPSPLSDDQFGPVESSSGPTQDSTGLLTPLFPSGKYWRVIVACYLLWIVYLLYRNLAFSPISSGWIWVSVLSAPLTHVSAFAFIAPLPWILPRRLPSPWRFILGFVLSLITCEAVSFFLPTFDGWLFRKAHIKFDHARLIQLYLAFVGPAMMVVGGLVAARARSEELRRASEVEALIARNRMLQSQVHPHVLFNALNGLAELVHKDPREAETAIRHLSDLLRRILAASEHMRLPLSEERSIVADYLALESIRLGARLRVVWEWDESLDKIEVPPLLLQPMVENAIKHGIAPSIPGGSLIIRGRHENRSVLLEVWNSGEPYKEKRVGKGIGQKNLSTRLYLHYGTKAAFSIGPMGEGTLACIRLDGIRVECTHEKNTSSGS